MGGLIQVAPSAVNVVLSSVNMQNLPCIPVTNLDLNWDTGGTLPSDFTLYHHSVFNDFILDIDSNKIINFSFL